MQNRINNIAKLNKHKIATITALDLAKSLTDGFFIENPNNRAGTDGPSKIRVKEISNRELFTISAFGLLHVYKTTEGVYELIDGHTRCRALVSLYSNAEILPSEERKDIELRIVPAEEARSLYLKLNNNKAHSMQDYLLNPELPFGELVTNIIQNPKKIKKQSIPFAATAYMMGKNGNIDWTSDPRPLYKEMMVSKIQVKKDSKLDSLSLTVDLNNLQRRVLTEAHLFTDKILEEISDIIQTDKGIDPIRVSWVKKSIDNSGVYQAFLILSMNKFHGGNFFKKGDTRQIARKFIKKMTDNLREACSKLAKKPQEADLSFNSFINAITK